LWAREKAKGRLGSLRRPPKALGASNPDQRDAGGIKGGGFMVLGGDKAPFGDKLYRVKTASATTAVRDETAAIYKRPHNKCRNNY
jgi:hypothetical protein